MPFSHPRNSTPKPPLQTLSNHFLTCADLDEETSGQSRKFLMSKARTAALAAEKKWNETHHAKSPSKAPAPAPGPAKANTGKKNTTTTKDGQAGISEITVVNIGDGLVPYNPEDPSTLPPVPKPEGAGVDGKGKNTPAPAPAPVGQVSDINVTQIAM